jgi:hypothetical protein
MQSQFGLNMESYSPASLCSITSVEVVSLKGIDFDEVEDYMADGSDVPSVMLYGEDAQRIADLWRSLPAGQQSRCHDPPFGLRFFSGKQVICEASICWECNNILGKLESEPLHY